jgi:uncharacterized protein (UPF0335 family)
MTTSNAIEQRIQMLRTLERLESEIKHNTESTKELIKALHANGLVTQVALNKQGINRLWKAFGGITTIIIAFIGWILRKNL